MATLERYVALLDKWRRVTNLISQTGFKDVWRRHIHDSARFFGMFADERVWLDIGSGAGFPAVVIGAFLSETACASVHCVESDKRKCAFLRDVADRLKLPLRVHETRAEKLTLRDTGHVDVVTARAFSSLPTILSIADAHLSEGSKAALPRGKTWPREIESVSLDRYTLDVRELPDEEEGAVVVVTKRQFPITHGL